MEKKHAAGNGEQLSSTAGSQGKGSKKTTIPVKIENHPAPPGNDPNDLIRIAVDKDFDIEKLKALVAMRDAWEAKENRKKFNRALARFQGACLPITKNKTVDFPTKENGQVTGRVNYRYASLDQIQAAIKKPLSENDLTYRWETEDDGPKLKVTCYITHSDGHVEKNWMTAGSDTSGKKNDIQSRGSAVSYMRRYTLTGALGLVAEDDVDGIKPKEEKKPDPKVPQLEPINSDMQDAIDAINRLEELTEMWNRNPDIQKTTNLAEQLRKRADIINGKQVVS